MGMQRSKVGQLLVGLFLLAGSAAADPPPVELALLLDTSSLGTESSFQAAREFCQDFAENLPADVHLQAFRFGGGPGRHPIDPLHLGRYRDLPTRWGPGSLTLQQVLTSTAQDMCRQPGAPSTKIAVILGHSRGAPLTLPGQCPITVYAVPTGGGDDEPLKILAAQTGGLYDLLGDALGFSFAKSIRTRTPPRPLVSAQPEQPQGHPWPTRPLVYGCVVVFLAVALLLLRSPRSRSAPPAEPMHVAPAVIPATGPPGDPAPPAPTVEARLTPLSGRGMGTGTAFPLSSGAVVVLGGRHHATGASSAHLLLDDLLVSGEHCQIYAEEGTFYVADLQSDLGTFVNHRQIDAPQPLAPGDILQIGETCFRFEAP
jgi:hypothetical protein